MRKLKLSLIANESSRKTTFMKRKKGMVKKLNELTTLCGVQACAVIYSPYLSGPEAWPSKEGIKEVVSKFMEVPAPERSKKMMNQEIYLQDRIAKVKEQVDKLAHENRKLELSHFMFACLEGKMSDYRFGAKDLHDLLGYIDQYDDQLTRRIQTLSENGESSSFAPLPVGVAEADPPALADFSGVPSAAAVSAPTGIYDRILYQNMIMNQNQQETIQPYVPTNSYDITQHHNMNLNHNLKEPVQYQAPTDLYDHIQQGGYNNMNMSFDLNQNPNCNFDLNSNQYQNQQQPFMGTTVEQPMGYAGGHESIPFMDGNNYNHHQEPVVDLAATSHVPSIIASTTTGVYDPYINNNL